MRYQYTEIQGYIDMANDRDYIKLINANKWRKVRKEKLTMNPLCERCFKDNKLTPATEVHHIQPIEEAATLNLKTALAYNINNLMSLCHQCHVEVHMELNKGSKQANKERQDERVKAFIDKFF